jgi:ribosomal protein L40E
MRLKEKEEFLMTGETNTQKAYCSKCGAKISDDALFCSRCGTRTIAGIKAGTSAPPDELHEALTRMSKDMEKAFNIAAKNIQEAFETARKNVQKTLIKEVIVCPKCSEKNSSNSSYCNKCGSKLYPDKTTEAK